MEIKLINAMEKILPNVPPQTMVRSGVVFTNERHTFQIAIHNDGRENCKRMRIEVAVRGGAGL